MSDKTTKNWAQTIFPKSQAGQAYLTLAFVYIILALTLENMIAFLAVGIVFLIIAYQQEETPDKNKNDTSQTANQTAEKEPLTLKKDHEKE